MTFMSAPIPGAKPNSVLPSEKDAGDEVLVCLMAPAAKSKCGVIRVGFGMEMRNPTMNSC